MNVYISPVAEGATPGIGHWLKIRDSLYMTTRRFTLSQQPGQSLDIERVGSLLLIFSDSDKSHAGRVLLLAPAQQERSIADTRAITLRECVRVYSVRIGRLNYILSLCSRATFSKFSTLYTATFPLIIVTSQTKPWVDIIVCS